MGGLRQKPSVMTKCLKKVRYECWPHLFPCLWSSRWIPHSTSRWVLTSVLIITFILRIIIKHGWYIVTYAWSMYLLSHLTIFLTSKIDPTKANLETEEDDGIKLPTKQNDEFRPFVRRLPEKFWYSITTATLIAYGCTFFEILDIPVFWSGYIGHLLHRTTLYHHQKTKKSTTSGTRSEEMSTTGD